MGCPLHSIPHRLNSMACLRGSVRKRSSLEDLTTFMGDLKVTIAELLFDPALVPD